MVLRLERHNNHMQRMWWSWSTIYGWLFAQQNLILVWTLSFGSQHYVLREVWLAYQSIWGITWGTRGGIRIGEFFIQRWKPVFNRIDWDLSQHSPRVSYRCEQENLMKTVNLTKSFKAVWKFQNSCHALDFVSLNERWKRNDLNWLGNYRVDGVGKTGNKSAWNFVFSLRIWLNSYNHILIS